jgi:SAM-dependent methyltransferase
VDPDQSRRFGPKPGVRSIAYRLLWACSDAFLRAANGCLFIAAGLLRLDERQSASREEWRRLNLSSYDVDAGLTPAEREFYSKFLKQSDRVLLVGCGSGRDLLALRLLGYDVTGIDQVPTLVEAALGHLARHGITAPVRTGEIEAADIDGSYDAVIFSGGCYSYLSSSRTRLAALARVRASLGHDGRVLVSYHTHRQQSGIGRWLTRISARLSGADWSPEAGDTFWRHHLVPGVLSYCHVFEREEFQRECTTAGFNVLAQERFDDLFCYAAMMPIENPPK